MSISMQMNVEEQACLVGRDFLFNHVSRHVFSWDGLKLKQGCCSFLRNSWLYDYNVERLGIEKYLIIDYKYSDEIV